MPQFSFQAEYHRTCHLSFSYLRRDAWWKWTPTMSLFTSPSHCSWLCIGASKGPTGLAERFAFTFYSAIGRFHVMPPNRQKKKSSSWQSDMWCGKRKWFVVSFTGTCICISISDQYPFCWPFLQSITMAARKWISLFGDHHVPLIPDCQFFAKIHTTIHWGKNLPSPSSRVLAGSVTSLWNLD